MNEGRKDDDPITNSYLHMSLSYLNPYIKDCFR